jgi:hypothetical protein
VKGGKVEGGDITNVKLKKLNKTKENRKRNLDSMLPPSKLIMKQV